MDEAVALGWGCPGLRKGRPVSLGIETDMGSNSDSATSYVVTLGGTLHLSFLLCDLVGVVSAGQWCGGDRVRRCRGPGHVLE